MVANLHKRRLQTQRQRSQQQQQQQQQHHHHHTTRAMRAAKTIRLKSFYPNARSELDF